MSAFQFAQIGVIRSPYKEKFAVPRQPGLVKHGGGELHLVAPYNQADAVRGLESFSHLWILFVFHQTMEGGWRPTVRPPRLGGNARMGVFATRSTFRPNPIGMSLVELKGIRCQKDQVILELGSLDLVDGTPIFDIKPYLPYADSHPDARGGFTDPIARKLLRVSAPEELREKFPAGLLGVLENDPRPRYQDDPERVYGLSFGGWNVRFRVAGEELTVLAMERADGGKEQR